MVRLCGQEQYKVEMGADARGNITRLDNALAYVPEKLKIRLSDLDTARQQLGTALAERDKPFEQEAELSEKSARLGELKTALQIDEREPVIITEDTPDEGDAAEAPQRKKADRER